MITITEHDVVSIPSSKKSFHTIDRPVMGIPGKCFGQEDGNYCTYFCVWHSRDNAVSCKCSLRRRVAGSTDLNDFL